MKTPRRSLHILNQMLTWENTILSHFPSDFPSPTNSPSAMASALPHPRRRASADGLLTVAASIDVNQQQKMKSPIPPAHHVWDCGSTLYDSFELFALSQHLNRAIAGEGISLPSGRIMRDGHARSLSMPHFATASTSQHYTSPFVKEDVDFSHNSKFETLHPKVRKRFGVPKLVKRLFSRLFNQRKGRDCPKSKSGDEVQSKVGRSPSERMLCFTQPLIKLR